VFNWGEREKKRNKNLSPHEHDIMCFIFDSISCGGERENREKLKKVEKKKKIEKRVFLLLQNPCTKHIHIDIDTPKRERMWNKDDEKSLWLYMLYMSYKYDDDDEILTNACKFSNILIDIFGEKKRRRLQLYYIHAYIKHTNT
jgi:hypothetical protein